MRTLTSNTTFEEWEHSLVLDGRADLLALLDEEGEHHKERGVEQGFDAGRIEGYADGFAHGSDECAAKFRDALTGLADTLHYCPTIDLGRVADLVRALAEDEDFAAFSSKLDGLLAIT